MEDKIDSFSTKQLLEMGINYVHEVAHSFYIKHGYKGAVEDTFLGDNLFGADMTIPIEERVDNVIKRAQ